MQPIRVINTEFNLISEIDDYESLIWTRRWHTPGEFELHISARKQSTPTLQKGRLLLAGRKVGLILHRELSQESTGGEQVLVKGVSLAGVLGRRITIPPSGLAYDRVNANAETVMKGFVIRNGVTPTDPRRAIPNLAIAVDQGRGAALTYQTRYKPLDEELEKLSLVSGLGWDVTLDWPNRQWVFEVLEGRDHTAGQTINPPVVFAAEFDVVQEQTFVESDIGHRNTAYVGGQGEGAARNIAEVGADLAGLERLEVFVDARDIEAAADLPERGRQKLAEVAPVLTFDTAILTQGPYRYGADWDLGDLVTVRNRKWGVTLDSRITEVAEIYEAAGFTLQATFGSNIPTLAERIKQELDLPLIEKGLLQAGEQGPPGERGEQGPPGYTPVKGVDYFDGEKGDPGPPGSDAQVTQANVLQAIGYTPVNRAGDAMTGQLSASKGVGAPTLKGHNTFQSTNGLAGVAGTTPTAGEGYLATYQNGIRAGVYGIEGAYSDGSTNYAGYFEGRVAVEGKLTAAQTEATDADEVVATKKYVDEKPGLPGPPGEKGDPGPPGSDAELASLDMSGRDLDTVTETGFYNGNNLTNTPVTGATSHYLIVNRRTSAQILQVVFRWNSSTKFWIRQMTNSNWGDWVEYADKDSSKGVDIGAGTTAPAGLTTGDWWYQEI